MLLVSRAPLEKLLAYKERMGWGIEWVSTVGGDFNRDLGFLAHRRGAAARSWRATSRPRSRQMARRSGIDTAGYVAEGPGLSAYALTDGVVHRTYVTTARGLEPAMAYYGLLDRTPRGRHEDERRVSGSGATTSTSQPDVHSGSLRSVISIQGLQPPSASSCSHSPVIVSRPSLKVPRNRSDALRMLQTSAPPSSERVAS